MRLGTTVLMIFGIKTQYNVFFDVTKNVPMLLQTGFMIQGHIFEPCSDIISSRQNHISGRCFIISTFSLWLLSHELVLHTNSLWKKEQSKMDKKRHR